MKIGEIEQSGRVRCRTVDAECPGPSILAASMGPGEPFIKLRMGDGEEDLSPQECRQLAFALEKAADIAGDLAGGE